MLQGEHSAILSTCIKLPFVIKNFVLFILERTLKTVLLYTDLLVLTISLLDLCHLLITFANRLDPDDEKRFLKS